MPDWWLEAALPAAVFGTLLVLWIVLPPRDGEQDIASRVRDWIFRRKDTS